MLENGEGLELTNLVDIKLLQEFQDSFAKTMNVACITIDEKGPITKPTNFTDFCNLYIKSEIGLKRYNECQLKYGKIAAEKGESVIYTCDTGLTEFIVPIIVADKHIGSIVSGQILTEPPNKDQFRKDANELGIDEDDYIKELRKIKVVSTDTVNTSAHLLLTIANIISDIAHKNFELIKKSEQESSLRKIFEAIRGSLDSNIIKNTIVNEIGKALEVDACFITAYDSEKDYFYVDEYSAYLSTPEEKSLVGADEKDPKFKWFIDQFRDKQEVIYSNVEKFIIQHNLQNTPEEEFIKEYNIKSSYNIPIYYANTMLGYISVSYTKNYRKLDENDLNFLRSLATQAGVAINQANLYNKMKLQAGREKLIGDVITKAVSTLDINEIKKVVKDIGIMMKADRCYFVEAILKDITAKPITTDSEYLLSPEIKSIVEYNFSAESVIEFSSIHIKTKDVTFFVFENFQQDKHFLEISKKYNTVKVKESQYLEIKKYGDMFNVKLGIGIPFIYMGEVKGVLSIEYMNKILVPSEDELNFLRISGNQMGMAINQIQLYQNIKKQVEREKFSRNIIEILRNATDKSSIKHLFVQNIGKYFGADRVFFSDFNPEINMYLPVDKSSEYLSSPEEKSFVDYDWSDDSIREYIQPLIEKRELKILCWDEYIKENSKSQGFISRFKDANVKSSYNFPVIYQEKIMGYFCIDFAHEVNKLSDEDIINIRSICTQAGIALHQAELFLQLQKFQQKGDL